MTARANDTGWHRHGDDAIHRDRHCPWGDHCASDRPVLVLDLADARERIAYRLFCERRTMRVALDEREKAAYYDLADLVLAALGASDPSGASDGEPT